MRIHKPKGRRNKSAQCNSKKRVVPQHVVLRTVTYRCKKMVTTVDILASTDGEAADKVRAKFTQATVICVEPYDQHKKNRDRQFVEGGAPKPNRETRKSSAGGGVVNNAAVGQTRKIGSHRSQS